jgi:uncharacterized protein YndB with AHSA1/START domain
MSVDDRSPMHRYAVDAATAVALCQFVRSVDRVDRSVNRLFGRRYRIGCGLGPRRNGEDKRGDDQGGAQDPLPIVSSHRSVAGERRRRLQAAALLCAVIAGAELTAIPAWSQPHLDRVAQHTRRNSMTMQGDLATRSPDIHWPTGFAPAKADLFAHNELVINAPCERVWKHIVAAATWPQWYPNSKDVRIISGGDVLKEGTVFRWTTFGLPLESKVYEYVPDSRLGWYGYSPGAEPTFYHSWYISPTGNACHVVMDEVGMGHDAAHLRETDESLMHRGHDLWLATLKWVSEGK